MREVGVEDRVGARQCWHERFSRELLVAITVLTFDLPGDGLRDALDVRMRSEE